MSTSASISQSPDLGKDSTRTVFVRSECREAMSPNLDVFDLPWVLPFLYDFSVEAQLRGIMCTSLVLPHKVGRAWATVTRDT